MEIKNGRISKHQAIRIIKEKGIQEPKEDITKLCSFLNIEKSHFYGILETFRNLDIWYKDRGKWKIRNFPIDNWNWE